MKSARSRSRLIRAIFIVSVCIAAAIFLQRVLSQTAAEISAASTREPAPHVDSSRENKSGLAVPAATASKNSTASVSPPATENSLTTESIETLAARDPLRAIALVLEQPESPLRDELLQAALRGWATVDANAAATWARTQFYFDHGLAMAAVFHGAIRNPEKAIQLNQKLSSDDPENAASYAGYLVFALNKIERFELSAQIAAESAAEMRVNLLTSSYRAWAAREPKQALASAMALSDPDVQRAAFEATLGGWAEGNPRELTEVAYELPVTSGDRKLALTTALRTWIEKDPAAAAEWASRVKPFPEMEASLEE